MSSCKLFNFCLYIILLVIKVCCNKMDAFSNLVHVGCIKTSCCNSGSTDSDTACYERLFGVVGDCILVYCNTDFVKSVFKFFTCDACSTKVAKHKVIICTA